MLVQSDERLLRAIVALKTRPEGLAFFEWLAQSQRQTLDALCDIVDDVALRQAQGAGETLRTINHLVENVDTLMQHASPRKR